MKDNSNRELFSFFIASLNTAMAGDENPPLPEALTDEQIRQLNEEIQGITDPVQSAWWKEWLLYLGEGLLGFSTLYSLIKFVKKNPGFWRTLRTFFTNLTGGDPCMRVIHRLGKVIVEITIGILTDTATITTMLKDIIEDGANVGIDCGSKILDLIEDSDKIPDAVKTVVLSVATGTAIFLALEEGVRIALEVALKAAIIVATAALAAAIIVGVVVAAPAEAALLALIAIAVYFGIMEEQPAAQYGNWA